jgi:hypothetical protein
MKQLLENCPTCGNALEGNHISCAACGWTMRNWRKELASQRSDPDHGCCTWRVNNLRCKYPGTLGASTTNHEHVYCRWHFGCTDPIHAARIVEESQHYRPESVEELTRAFDADVQRSLEKLGLKRRQNEQRESWIGRLRDFCRQGVMRLAGRGADVKDCDENDPARNG